VSDAAAAFAAGWALSGAPLGERFDAGIRAAVLAAGDCPGPHVIEATLSLGNLSGVWADVYARQDALYAAQVRKLTRLWRELTAGLAVDRMVASFRSQALMQPGGAAPGTGHETPDARAQRKRELRDLALSAAAGMLAGLAALDSWDGFLAAVALALAAASGEGFAAALAVAAADAGVTGFGWEAAQQAGRSEPDGTETSIVAGVLVSVMASGLAAVLVALAVAGATAEAMARAVTTALHEAGNLALTATHAMASAVSTAWLAVYDAASVERILWVTAGDGRVCPVCDGYEENNPYTPATFPMMPAHYGDRCSPHSEGGSAALFDMYAAYITKRRAA
jgi:hypothetical protein